MGAPAPDAVKSLVDQFDQDRKVFLSSDYMEEQPRLGFLNALYTALGWEMGDALDKILDRNRGSVPLFSGFTVVAVDERIANQAVTIKRRHGLKTPDAIIAATALVENATLVTRDQDMLDKVPEVRSLNPFVG
jgi:hypothetical protein